MSKYYDISAKITNELPTIKITDDIICTVNNRKSTILNIQAMLQEKEKKEHTTEQEFEDMIKALEMLVGSKSANEIDKLDLPINEFTEVFTAIMNVAQGMELEMSTPSK